MLSKEALKQELTSHNEGSVCNVYLSLHACMMEIVYNLQNEGNINSLSRKFVKMVFGLSFFKTGAL